MEPKVKICGITRASDALSAVEAGADLLGFMFYERSPRFISTAAAADVVRALPPFAVKVGVFVDAEPDLVLQAIRDCRLDMLQFHGDEPPDYCLQFGLMTMKAFRIRNADSLGALPPYATDAWLLDAFVPGTLGGSGATFNWDLAVQARTLGRPVFLAGGLKPSNVAEAVRHVQPYGVDVSSGVESAPGKKDPQKVRDFIAAAKGVR
jgi:phosphoribosylanthranilate isomerase